MYSELERNLPGHPDWEGSFYEKLTDYGEWDVNAFWKLHLDFLEIAESVNGSNTISRDLARKLLLLQQKVLNLVSSHFNDNDVYEIANIETDLLYEFIERFEMAILGAVSGEVHPESSFGLVNPLVKNA